MLKLLNSMIFCTEKHISILVKCLLVKISLANTLLILFDILFVSFIKLQIIGLVLHFLTNFIFCAFLFYFYRLIIFVVEYFDLDHLLINSSAIMDNVKRGNSFNAKN